MDEIKPVPPALPQALITSDRLAGRVRRLGQRIEDDYRHTGVDMVIVLKGAAMFGADLARAIDPQIDVRLHYLPASSYSGESSTGEVRLAPLPEGVGEQRPILFVEDIVDTGLTARALLGAAWERLGEKPAQLRVAPHLAALLDKPSRRSCRLPEGVPNYVGFEIPDVFVVGYGMDHDQRWRNLGWVGVLNASPEAVTAASLSLRCAR